MAVETEIKLRWPHGAEAARSLIEQHGYSVRNPRQLETDQLYDHLVHGLRQAGKLLRLRSAGGSWVLTYKGPLEGGSTPYKSREEIESGIADGPAFALVLERLGYQPSFRYEKFRTIFVRPAEPGIVTLDETPIGDFLELEGPEYWIDATARTLGFSPADYLTASYAALYQEFAGQNRGAPGPRTF